VKIGLIQSLRKRASTTCQQWQDPVNVISNLRCDLQLNRYPQGFIDSVINSKGSSCPNKEEKPLGSVYSPYVQGVSEKFEHTRSDNKVHELATVCLPWQQSTETSVWFDDVGISAFHSCVVVHLWQSLSGWHLLLSECVLVCCRKNVRAWIRATNEY
jgi:hypothetical protein